MDNITIQDASLEDAEHISDIYAYYVKNTAITFEYDVLSLSEMQDRIKNTMEHFPYLVIKQAGIIQGYAYASPFNTIGTNLRKKYSKNAQNTGFQKH